jgi:hypothetical protein
LKQFSTVVPVWFEATVSNYFGLLRDQLQMNAAANRKTKKLDRNYARSQLQSAN